MPAAPTDAGGQSERPAGRRPPPAAPVIALRMEVCSPGPRSAPARVAMWVRRMTIHEFAELLDGDLDGADYVPESSTVEFMMQRHRDRRASHTHEADVAAFLTEEGVSELGKCRHAGGAGNDGRVARSGSNVDVDNLVVPGQLPASCSLVSRQSSMASRMLARASSWFLP